MEKLALGMGALRMLSGAIEISAALLIFHFATVEKAFKINAVLALIGPLILITVTSLGIIGLADQLPLSRMLIILAGVGLIFYGMRGF
ncbi:hypothetical protein GGQ84_000906 [Desulfitispora alkaliphila]|uniref:YqhV family protein n=1 Tax=Desulfitispora alkaliphila TaxID=622674 RepID=UPI003D21F595